MAECCQNVVTPKMIKAGQVSVGDRIQLDEQEEIIAVQGPAAESVAVQGPAAENNENEAIPVQAYMPAQEQLQESIVFNSDLGIAGIPGGVIHTTQAPDGASHHPESHGMTQRTIAYSQMTPYLNNVSSSGTAENPTIKIPQSPLIPNGFEEEIDNTALQSFNGFLRTQIGRYMRVEQLVSTDRTEDRFGFLVGVGSNFIILQDITTGNIMVIDIFSIRLTYVYYSPAVVPNF